MERQNLNLRMGNRRYTRRTNAFSKKIKILKLSLDLYFLYYSFMRKHETLGCTPSEAAGLRDLGFEDVIEELRLAA